MPSSGAGGPCCHCGRTNSCCWRRGPASKPVLCNACGSRYLVKRSLDGYQPLQTRREQQQSAKEAGGSGKEPAARRAAPAAAAGRVSKPKRAAQKRMESDWSSELDASEASDGAAHTDDSAASGRTVAVGRPRRQQHQRRSASPASLHLNTTYITSQAQLKSMAADIAGAFFASSLRLKPRKPLVVTVSAVW